MPFNIDNRAQVDIDRDHAGKVGNNSGKQSQTQVKSPRRF